MNKVAPVVWIIGMGILASVIVWERVYATHLGKAVSNAREDLALKQARNEHFKLELESLTSPSSLEHMASQRLAMAYPDPDRVLTINESVQTPRTSGWLAKLFDKREAGL